MRTRREPDGWVEKSGSGSVSVVPSLTTVEVYSFGVWKFTCFGAKAAKALLCKMFRGQLRSSILLRPSEVKMKPVLCQDCSSR